MGIRQRVKCNFRECRVEYEETNFNGGFPGWGKIYGLDWDGEAPYICPEHLVEVASFIKPGDKKPPEDK